MKIKNRFFALFTNAVFMVFLSGCNSRLIQYDYINNDAYNTASNSGRIVSSGSTSMTKLINSLGEEFSKKHNNITVEKSDTGSGAAILSVLDGSSMLGDISREIKEDEDAWKFEQKVIAIDGIALVVNKENPISSLTDAEIKDIFTGKIINWSELQGYDLPITLIGREESSGTREGFEHAFGIEKEKKYYSAEFPESGDILSKVGSDPSCIGYTSTSSVSSNVKALKINGVEASTENILNKRYIVQRPFIQIYLKGNKHALIDKWFDFLFSEDGQDIIKGQGFIPTISN